MEEILKEQEALAPTLNSNNEVTVIEQEAEPSAPLQTEALQDAGQAETEALHQGEVLKDETEFGMDDMQQEDEAEDAEQAQETKNPQAALHERLALEFLTLQSRLPQVANVGEISDEMFALAVHKGYTLTEAYLTCRNAELEAMVCQLNQEKHLATAPGKLQTAQGDAQGGELAAMHQGIWG